GVEPDAAGAALPGPLDRRAEQGAAEALSDELRQQAEVGNLDVPVRLALELEVAGRRAGHGADPGLMLRPGEPGHPPVPAPGKAVHPEQVAADGAVEEAVELGAGDLRPLDPQLRARPGRAEVLAVRHLQMPGGDLAQHSGDSSLSLFPALPLPNFVWGFRAPPQKKGENDEKGEHRPRLERSGIPRSPER